MDLMIGLIVLNCVAIAIYLALLHAVKDAEKNS